MATSGSDNVIFSVVFKKGLADQNRLPLNHVIEVLQEIDRMIREVGRYIQRDAGIEHPDGDFGIELLATRTGLAFRKGSLGAQLPITRNIEFGIQAISALIDTTDVIEKRRPLSVGEYGERILRRLPRLTEIQEQDRTELHMSLSRNRRVFKRTKLGKRGIETLRSFEAAELEVEGVTLYGKLRELKDLSRLDADQSEYFWGELLEDNGHRWRIRFRNSCQDRVLHLFRKQVSVVGDATYFKTKPPCVDVSQIDEASMPDYVSAFDSFREAYTDIFQDRDTEEILRDIRE